MTSEDLADMARLNGVGVLPLLASTCACLLPRLAKAATVEVCVEGYIIDFYCLNRGAFLDTDLPPLEKPGEHTVHCLVDVERCYTSGFEVVIEEESGSSHCRAFKLDEKGNADALALARRTGAKGGCSTCTGNATHGLEKGFRATINGTYDDSASGEPVELTTTSVEPSSVGCGGKNIGVKTCIAEAGTGRAPILAHGTLMMFSWGALLPSGVVVAHFLRHRDPLWFKIHRGIQMFGLVVALVGVALALMYGSHAAKAHMGVGLSVMVLGVGQPVNAFFRPHREKDVAPTAMRRIWEVLHKGVGYLAIALGMFNVGVGTTVLGGDAALRFQVAYGVVVAAMALLGGFLIYDRWNTQKDLTASAKSAELATIKGETLGSD